MVRTRRFWVQLAAVACFVMSVAASPARADLQSRVRGIIDSADLRQTQVGVMITDLSTGRTLAHVNPDEPMMPASNMKLVTTAAALRVLGTDFVFRTELRMVTPEQWPAGQGVAPTGTVLVVEGDGDPGFGDPELLRLHDIDAEQLIQVWVDAVLKAGVKHVERLIIDDRVFDREWVHPTWPAEQLNAWYCAPVAGLNFYDNCIDVFVDPTRSNQPPVVRLMPAAPFFSVSNRATTGPVDNLLISRKPNTNEISVVGKIKNRRSNPVSVTVHDPAMFFGQLLAQRLAAQGVAVANVARPALDDMLPEGKVLHAIENTLPLILARCNKDSQNLFAEALLKRMGRAVTGAPGSWENGAATIRLFLRDQLGPQSASVIIADGSGMSRDNRVSAQMLVSLLASMHADPKTSQLYRESLSIGGDDGTLRARFRKDFQSQVYGKSGYINGVSTLSGYVVTPGDGTTPARTIAFSFLFNNFKAPVFPHNIKAVQDQLVQLIDRTYAPPPVRLQQGG